jgi:tetratricopeptide (TPR) repeat protein
MDLVELTLIQPREDQELFLRDACGADEELLTTALSYVLAEQKMDGFLTKPLFDLAQPDMPFEAGELLDGRFLIIREVARGGMGIVYEAFDQKLERRIAIKCAQQGFRKQLPPEVRNAREISHANVCKIFDIHRTATERGQIDFMTMEFLDGETLDQRLANGLLPDSEALDIACQLCAGVAEAHREQVIHGDLKTSNIILTTTVDGRLRAVITDFGLARRPEPRLNPQSEIAGGTLAYMAPELLSGEDSSVASDIYALGVVLEELIIGARPSAGETERVERMGRKTAVEATPLQARWKRISHRCLAADPKQRFRTAAEIAAALDPPPQAKRRWLVAAATAAALSIAATVLATRDRSTTPAEAIRLAVLPFEADAVSESIGRALLQDTADRLQGVRPGRVRLTLIPFADALKNKVDHVELVPQKLGGTHALWGSLHNENGVTVVHAHLTDTRLQLRLADWSARYSPEELRNFPVALSGMVVGALGLPPLSSSATVKPAAYPVWSEGVALLRGNPKDIDRALSLLGQAVTLDSNSPLTHARLAEAQLQKYRLAGDSSWWDLAYESLAKAERRNPDTAQVRFVSAVLNDAKGRYDEAEADLKRAVEIEPVNGDLWRQLGIVYKHKNQADNALRAFQKALELQPDYFRNYSELAGFYYDRFDFDQAVVQYKKMVETAPGLAEAHYQLSRPYLDMGRFADAEREARIAIGFRETSDAVHILALSLMHQNRNRESIAYYLRALDLGPPAQHKYILYLNLGSAYRRSGLVSDARRTYSQALELAYGQLDKNPADALVRADLSYLYAHLGNRREAEFNVRQALAGSPDDIVVRWLAIQTYNVLDELDKAISLLKDAPAWLLERVSQFSDFARLQRDERFVQLRLSHPKPN